MYILYVLALPNGRYFNLDHKKQMLGRKSCVGQYIPRSYIKNMKTRTKYSCTLRLNHTLIIISTDRGLLTFRCAAPFFRFSQVPFQACIHPYESTALPRLPAIPLKVRGRVEHAIEEVCRSVSKLAGAHRYCKTAKRKTTVCF